MVSKKEFALNLTGIRELTLVVLGIRFAGLGRHGSTVPAHKITALLKVYPVYHDISTRYLTTYSLLGILCDRIPSDDGPCDSKAFCSLPFPPYLCHSQFSDYGSGSGCHHTSMVGKSYRCGRFHMLSDPSKLAADNPKTLREHTITPSFRTSPMDLDRLCDIDSPTFRDQKFAA